MQVGRPDGKQWPEVADMLVATLDRVTPLLERLP
jgi:hypothetical protein